MKTVLLKSLVNYRIYNIKKLCVFYAPTNVSSEYNGLKLNTVSCWGSTTLNRVISEVHFSKCVAVIAATGNWLINEHVARMLFQHYEF